MNYIELFEEPRMIPIKSNLTAFYEWLKSDEGRNWLGEQSGKSEDTKCGLGNTISPHVSTNNTRAINWCFTLNNFTLFDVEEYIRKFMSEDHGVNEYEVIPEIGESGTRHLQGCIQFKSKKGFNAVRKLLCNNNNGVLSQPHIEKCKATYATNVLYCRKSVEPERWEYYQKNKQIKSKSSNKRKSAKQIEKEELQKKIDDEKKLKLEEYYGDVSWKPFQQHILDIIETKTDERSIYWIWEEEGNVGKSYLSEFIWLSFEGTLRAEGKSDNISYAAMEMVKNEGVFPKIILCDIPRSKSNYLNSGMLETLKNGSITSGKYETGSMGCRYPHVIVFSNAHPSILNVSSDRIIAINARDYDKQFESKVDKLKMKKLEETENEYKLAKIRLEKEIENVKVLKRSIDDKRKEINQEMLSEMILVKKLEKIDKEEEEFKKRKDEERRKIMETIKRKKLKETKKLNKDDNDVKIEDDESSEHYD